MSNPAPFGRFGRLILAALIGLLFILPLYSAVIASLGKVGAPPPTRLVWWPINGQWGNYRDLFDLVPMGRYVGNSLRVVLAAVPLTWLTASWGGFGLVQLSKKGQRLLVSLSAVLLIVPAAAVWLIRFQIYSRLGLLDSLWALIAPALAGGSPLFVLLFYWTFRRIPYELIEAALLDGASWWRIWWQVALPLARPASSAVIVLAFVKFWSDFTDPVLYIFDTQKYTLPIGLQLIKQLDATNLPYLMAASTIMLVPVMVLFLVAQRVFMKEISIARLLDRD